jgi:hypothetical protein
MVPSSFVLLDALPLTPNGKLDRKALPDAEARQTETKAVYVPPQTELEKIIAAAWQEALGLDRVGVHDNFFELGGNSLLMVQVEARLRANFDMDALIVQMFRFPTISSLADYLGREEAERPASRTDSQQALSRRETMTRQKQLRRQSRTTIKQPL